MRVPAGFPTPPCSRHLRWGLSCLLSAGLAAISLAQTPTPAGVLVSGAGLAQAVPMKAAQLAALHHSQVVRAGHDGQPRTYSGVALYAVLTAAGAELSPAKLPGKGMAHYLLVSAADNYQAVFALAELDPAFAPRTVLLADRCDGQPLPPTAGPYQVIVPDEKKMGRCVRQVSALRVVAAQPLAGRCCLQLATRFPPPFPTPCYSSNRWLCRHRYSLARAFGCCQLA